MREACRQHVCRQSISAGVKLSPRDDSIALNLAGVIWNTRGDSFIQVGKVPVRHDSPSRSEQLDATVYQSSATTVT